MWWHALNGSVLLYFIYFSFICSLFVVVCWSLFSRSFLQQKIRKFVNAILFFQFLFCFRCFVRSNFSHWIIWQLTYWYSINDTNALLTTVDSLLLGLGQRIKTYKKHDGCWSRSRASISLHLAALWKQYGQQNNVKPCVVRCFKWLSRLK